MLLRVKRTRSPEVSDPSIPRNRPAFLLAREKSPFDSVDVALVVLGKSTARATTRLARRWQGVCALRWDRPKFQTSNLQPAQVRHAEAIWSEASDVPSFGIARIGCVGFRPLLYAYHPRLVNGYFEEGEGHCTANQDAIDASHHRLDETDRGWSPERSGPPATGLSHRAQG